MNHEEVRHLRQHMHFRNTDRHRTCIRKEGDAEVTNTYTRHEGDDESKETYAKGSKVISFHLLWPYCLSHKVLGQRFLVHLKAALNPEDRLLENRKHLTPN
jgi:hypothetical protein